MENIDRNGVNVLFFLSKCIKVMLYSSRFIVSSDVNSISVGCFRGWRCCKLVNIVYGIINC